MEENKTKETKGKRYEGKSIDKLKNKKITKRGAVTCIIVGTFLTALIIAISGLCISGAHKANFKNKKQDINQLIVVDDMKGQSILLAPCGKEGEYAEVYADNHEHYTITDIDTLSDEAVPGIYEVYDTINLFETGNLKNQNTIVTNSSQNFKNYMTEEEITKAEVNGNKITAADLKEIKARLEGTLENKPKVYEKTPR